MIDVVLLTCNSSSALGEKFNLCLQQAFRNIPIRRLIVVDGGSKDGTVERVRSFAEENRVSLVVIEDVGGTRGSSRQKGIESVETEWFLFLDSDCVLCDGWFNKVKEYMVNPKVGAIQGRCVDVLDDFSERYVRVREAIKDRFGRTEDVHIAGGLCFYIR